MKFLLSFLAILALAQSVLGQIVLPFTSLTISAVDANTNAAVTTPAITPSFSAYRGSLLRYAAEIAYDNPILLTINWAGSNSVRIRNCESQLTSPTQAQNSYCFFSQANNVAGTSGTVFVNPGTSFIELATTGSIGGASATVLYVITIGLYSAPGSNMLSLETIDAYSYYNTPYTLVTSQYTINYFVDQSPSLVTANIPFYFAAQKSVTRIFVQECPGSSCNNCNVNTLSARKVLAGSIPSPNPNGHVAVPGAQIDGNSRVSTADFPKNGLYYFPASIGQNCVRFINEIDAGDQGTNQYTITISLPVTNCQAQIGCQLCVNNVMCGFCQTDQFNMNAGSCRIGDDQNSYTGTTCTRSTSFQTVPRWIWNPTPTVGDAGSCFSTLKGDPRISGLQGQDFQVHGTPNEYFNLVSSASLQVNSRFVYLEEAKCDNMTACFSHPGTYIDEIGVMMADNKVRLVAGAINEAARVFINGKEVLVSSHKHTAGKITVTFANARRIIVKTPEYMMTVTQSDKFFNVESALLKTELLDQGSKMLKLESSRAAEANTIMHGLIGQTWRNVVYAGDREYEGEVTDYQVADGIWGKDFTFNLYH